MKKILMIVAAVCGLSLYAKVVQSTIEYTAQGGVNSAQLTYTGSISYSDSGNVRPSWVLSRSSRSSDKDGTLTYSFTVAENTGTTDRSYTYTVTVSGNTWEITLHQAAGTGSYVHEDPIYMAGTVSTISGFPYGTSSTSTIVGFSNLSAGNFDLENYPYTFTCDSVPDAEKTSGQGVDYTWCAQLTDVNLLTYGGYAAKAGFANADALADYLRANSAVANGGDVIAHVLGMGGCSSEGVRTFLPQTQGGGALLNAFKNGFGGGKSLASVGLLFRNGNGGVIHVVAICGYMVDSYYAESDPQHLAGIYYIDPDDDKGATPAMSPNRIRYCDLSWDSSSACYVAQRDFSWEGVNYFGGALYCDGTAFGYFLTPAAETPGEDTPTPTPTPTPAANGVINAAAAAGTYATAASFGGSYTLTTSGMPDWIKAVAIKVGNSNYALDASISGTLNVPISGDGTVAVTLAENTGAARSFAWTVAGRSGTDPVTITINQSGVGGSVVPGTTGYAITYLNTKGVGNPNPDTYSAEGVSAFKPLANTAEYTFNGWTPSSIAPGTVGAVEVTANWVKTEADVSDRPEAAVANTYDCLLYNADYALAGAVQVKLAKAKAGVSKLTATIQAAGKKLTVSGSFVVADGVFSVAAKDGNVLSLTIGKDGVYGTFGSYVVEGARNIFTSKASEDKAEASAVLDSCKGAYTMAFWDGTGWNGLSVSIAAKGKVKVSGTLLSGAKVSATAQLIAGDGVAYVPVIVDKANLAFVLWLTDGEAEVTGLEDAVFAPVGALDAEATFVIEDAIADLYDNEDTELLDDYLPTGLSVAASGSKWIVDGGSKAGKLVWNKSEGAVDEAKSKITGYNVSGLKLTYTAKTGMFKGTFKVYTVVKGSLKTATATVSGVVVDGVGYGSAVIKKVGTVAVAIE